LPSVATKPRWASVNSSRRATVRRQTAAQAGLAGGQPGMVLVKGLQQGQAFFQPGNPVPALQRRGVGGEGLYGRHVGLTGGSGVWWITLKTIDYRTKSK
jgi:hypothetical protein